MHRDFRIYYGLGLATDTMTYHKSVYPKLEWDRLYKLRLINKNDFTQSDKLYKALFWNQLSKGA